MHLSYRLCLSANNLRTIICRTPYNIVTEQQQKHRRTNKIIYLDYLDTVEVISSILVAPISQAFSNQSIAVLLSANDSDSASLLGFLLFPNWLEITGHSPANP